MPVFPCASKLSYTAFHLTSESSFIGQRQRQEQEPPQQRSSMAIANLTAIEPFTGIKEDQDAKKWLRRFEREQKTVRAPYRTRMHDFKRLLAQAAADWAETEAAVKDLLADEDAPDDGADEIDDEDDWHTVKSAFIIRFGKPAEVQREVELAAAVRHLQQKLLEREEQEIREFEEAKGNEPPAELVARSSTDSSFTLPFHTLAAGDPRPTSSASSDSTRDTFAAAASRAPRPRRGTPRLPRPAA